MILGTADLLRLIDAIPYPADILAQKDDRVMFRVTRPQLRAMIEAGGITGVGSRNRVKRLRLSGAVVAVAEEVYASSRWHGRVKYFYREEIANKPFALKRVGVGGHYEEWPDDARFTPSRFNPDAIPAPLIAHESSLKKAPFNGSRKKAS